MKIKTTENIFLFTYNKTINSYKTFCGQRIILKTAGYKKRGTSLMERNLLLTQHSANLQQNTLTKIKTATSKHTH